MGNQGKKPAARPVAGGSGSVPGKELAQRLYRIGEVARITSLSRSVIYEQIRSGRLRSVHQGRAHRVTAGQLDDYIKLLEREAEAAR